MNIHPEKPPAKRGALASSTADLRELRSHSRATVAELQAFLRELKGRSPQEMLGLVAGSQLVRSIGLSSAIVAGAILLFTAIPYFFASEETPVAVIPAAAPPPADPTPEAPPAEPAPAVPEPDPLSNLGVGGEIAAPPDKNPLENQGDDFLKDLE
jgi:hypothetical protein